MSPYVDFVSGASPTNPFDFGRGRTGHCPKHRDRVPSPHASALRVIAETQVAAGVAPHVQVRV